MTYPHSFGCFAQIMCLCGTVHTGKDPLRPLFDQDYERFRAHLLPLAKARRADGLPRLPSWTEMLARVSHGSGKEPPPRFQKGAKCRPPVFPDKPGDGWLASDVLSVMQPGGSRLSRKKCVESIRRCGRTCVGCVCVCVCVCVGFRGCVALPLRLSACLSLPNYPSALPFLRLFVSMHVCLYCLRRR